MVVVFFYKTIVQVLLKELRILKEKVEHLEDQKLQYEKKLKATKVKWTSDFLRSLDLDWNTPQLPKFH